MGRPKYILPENFESVIKKYHDGSINYLEAMKILNMTKGTFFKYSKVFKEKNAI